MFLKNILHIKKQKKFSTFYVLVGVIIYVIGCKIILFDNESLANIVCIIGVLIAFSSIFFNKFQFTKPLTGIYQMIYYLFLFYIIICVFRGFFMNPPTAVIAIRNPKALLGFLTPFIVLLGIHNFDLKIIFQLCYIASLIAIIYLILNFNEIFLTPHIEMLGLGYNAEETTKGQLGYYFVIPAALLLMNYQLVSSKYIIVTWIAFVLSMGSAIAYGRRTVVAMHVVFILSTIYIYMISRDIQLYKKILIVIICFTVPFILIGQYLDFQLFEVLSERLDSDSRTPVADAFYSDFRGKTLDWLFGRGLSGVYYSPNFYLGSPYRDTIETGYLQLILNGGVILLILYLLITLRAFYCGFFKSRNTLSKTMAIYILVLVVFLVSGNSFEFTFKGVILWFCIMYCYSNKWRLKTDQDIKMLLK
jgi:hypothetical protein